jgi:hypothetical protein
MHARDTVEIKSDVIRIIAEKSAARVIEFEMKDPDEPGNVPNWFPGVILLLRDEIQDDEKIVVQNRVIKIVKKSPVDRVLDWIKGRRSSEGTDISGPADNGGLHH